MIYIIIVCILSIILLMIGLDIHISDIKKVKKIACDKQLNNITNKLPENKEICKSIIQMCKNDNVIIEESKDKDSKTSLYLVMSNKIIIANIKDTFTRIQTIAHECIHSLQNKKILKFNFIFSNIYILYFSIACIITLIKWFSINVEAIILIIFIMLSFIYFAVRSFVEIEAMIKAKYLARKYMENSQKLEKYEIENIIGKYDEINNIGIKLYVFFIALSNIIKIIVLTICINIRY